MACLAQVPRIPGSGEKQLPGRLLLECLRDRRDDVLRFLTDLRIPDLRKTPLKLSSVDLFISGGNFPVGGTTLTCTATDTIDGTSTAPPPTQSFTVIITNTPCATLAGCNLHGLDLSNAILAGADLSSGTDLSNANLNEADLSGANLPFANLSGANLNQADLTGANLTGANLTGANLTNAKLDGVTWSNTTCPDGTNSSASTPETCVGHL